jgi:hypothetical protein
MFATGAGNRDNLRAFTVLETGNLRRLRKTGADYADSDGFLVRHFLFRTACLESRSLPESLRSEMKTYS